MTVTAICQITDADGHAAKYWRDGLGREHLDALFAHPAAAFDDDQPAPIKVTIGHGGSLVGHVGYLEHGLDSNSDLTAVCVLDDGLVPDDVDGLYTSADVAVFERRDEVFAERCRLEAVAIVAATAGIAAKPLRAFAGDYRVANDRNRWGRRIPTILERAAQATPDGYRWRAPTSLRIHRPIVPAHRNADGRPSTGYLQYRPGVILAIR